jgi:transcriptional antiterminator NusG
MAWVLFSTKKGKELKIKKLIEDFINNKPELQNKVRKVLVPIKASNAKGGMRATPLFRGYIFIDMDIDDDLINQFRNFDLKPVLKEEKNQNEKHYSYTILTDEEIEKILSLSEKELEKIKNNSPFVVGDYAEVIDGSFKGLQGKVIEVYPEKSKVKLLVNILGRETEIEIPFNCIKAIFRNKK